MFEEDFLPGYAWMFPVGGGRANLGFGVLRDGASGSAPSGKALAAQWRSLVDRPSVRRALGPHAQPEGTHRAWPIPASYDRARLVHGRALFVGDAASVVDPMTGEGIAQALETGALAVARHRRVAVRHRGRRAPLPRRRRPCARRRPEVRRAAPAPPARAARARVPRIAAAALTPWTRRNFARWMFEDYPRALVLTPGRWHRGMFTGPGAYRDAG